MNQLTRAPLAQLAGQIKEALRLREVGREQWVIGTLALCQRLAEARAQFPDNPAFSRWLIENGLGDDVLSHQDRAAAIDMGQHLEEAKPVLEQTERRSLRLIHRNEFHLTSAGKMKPPAPERPNKNAARDAEIIAAFDAGTPPKEIAATTGLVERRVHRIIEDERYRRKGVKQGRIEAEIDPTTLPLTAKQRLDAAIRQATKRLEIEIEQRLRMKQRRFLEETMLPQYRRESDHYRAVIAGRKGVLKRAEYRKILSCLHPDRVTDPGLQARYQEAFNIFSKLELLVVPEAELPLVGGVPPLPTTVAELLARRKKKW